MPQVMPGEAAGFGLPERDLSLLASFLETIADRLRIYAVAFEPKYRLTPGRIVRVLLAGLLLNALFGWWWADPFAALVMVPIIVREGIEGFRGKLVVMMAASSRNVDSH